MANVYSITFAIICIVGGCVALLLLSIPAPQIVSETRANSVAQNDSSELPPVTSVAVGNSLVLRTVNVGNDSMLLDGRRFIPLSHAQAQGLQITGGEANQGRGGISTPGLDFDRKTLLDSGFTSQSGILILRQTAPMADYAWWLWLADPNGLDHSRIRVRCGAQEFRLDATQSNGQFGRFGPFPATADAAGLSCEIRGLVRGHLAACEIWSGTQPLPHLPINLQVTWPDSSPVAGDRLLLFCSVIGGLPAHGEVRLLVNGQVAASATQEPYDLRSPPLATGRVEMLVEAICDGVILAREKSRVFSIPDTSGGGLLLEQWRELPGSGFSARLLTLMSTTPPDHSGPVNVAAVDHSLGQQHLTRLRGYLHPPATGDYVFLLFGRGGCELRLGEDASTKSPRLVAALSAEQTQSTTTKIPWTSAPVRLVAGLRYALELRHKNGVGLAGMSLGWALPDGQQELPIGAARLSPATPTTAPFEVR